MTSPTPSSTLSRWDSLLQGETLSTPDTLSPKLSLLMKSMKALHAGDTAALEALASSCAETFPDLSKVLAVLLDPEDQHTVDELSNTDDLRLRDLTAAFCVARTGLPGPWNESLLRAAGLRPLLHSAFRLFITDATEVYTNPILEAISPRANELQMVSRAVQMTGYTALDALQTHLGRPLHLSLPAEQWPTVHTEPEPGDILHWSRTRAGWAEDHSQTLSPLLDPTTPKEGSADEAATLLGAMLGRFARDIPLGRLTGLSGPVRAAESLAERFGSPTLAEQLSCLRLHVEYFDPEFPTPERQMSLALWQASADLPGAYRWLAAKRVLDLPANAVEPEIFREALFFAMAHIPSAEDSGALLLEFAAGMHPGLLIGSLRDVGAEPFRLSYLASLHACGVGYLAQGLKGIPKMIEVGFDAASIRQLFRAAAAATARRGSIDEAALPVLQLAYDALIGSSLGLSVWGPILANPQLQAKISPAHHQQLRQQLSAVADTPEDLAVGIVLATTLGEGPQASALVKQAGRMLRGLDEKAGTVAALDLIGRWFTWNPHAARQIIETQGKPLSKYLLRKSGAPLTVAMNERAHGGPLIAGILDWYLAFAQESVPSQPFRDHLQSTLSVPEEYRGLFNAAVQTVDLRQARSFPQVITHLQQAVTAQLHAPEA